MVKPMICTKTVFGEGFFPDTTDTSQRSPRSSKWPMLPVRHCVSSTFRLSVDSKIFSDEHRMQYAREALYYHCCASGTSAFRRECLYVYAKSVRFQYQSRPYEAWARGTLRKSSRCMTLQILSSSFHLLQNFAILVNTRM